MHYTTTAATATVLEFFQTKQTDNSSGSSIVHTDSSCNVCNAYTTLEIDLYIYIQYTISIAYIYSLDKTTYIHYYPTLYLA